MAANTVMKLEWRGWRGFNGRFASEAPIALSSTLDRLGIMVRDIMHDESPLGKPGSGPPGYTPGALRRMLVIRKDQRGTSGSVEIASTAPHTRYVITGHGPIYPVTAKALRFWIGGRVIFRKRVGPVSPNDFITRTVKRTEPLIEGQLTQLVGRYTVMMLTE